LCMHSQCSKTQYVGKHIKPFQREKLFLLKLKMYGVHLEFNFVWQNRRCWQDICSSLKSTFL